MMLVYCWSGPASRAVVRLALCLVLLQLLPGSARKLCGSTANNRPTQLIQHPASQHWHPWHSGKDSIWLLPEISPRETRSRQLLPGRFDSVSFLMLSMAVFSAVVISNSWVTGQRDLRDLALARINGTNSRIIHMTLHHTAPTSSRSWGGDWRLGSYLKPVLSKLMTRFLLSVHVLSTPDLLRSATKESLLQLDPGCAEMIKYVQILTTILKPRWHELAEKLSQHLPKYRLNQKWPLAGLVWW